MATVSDLTRNLDDLMKGVTLKVYANADGKKWHAHVATPGKWERPNTSDNWIDNTLSVKSRWWVSITSDDEATVRQMACDVMGRVYAWRLGVAIGPIEVPARVIPAPREVSL